MDIGELFHECALERAGAPLHTDEECVFIFHTLQSIELFIRQRPSQGLASIIYPGALYLCGYLEEHWDILSLTGHTVLELGAGVCGLPSLVLAQRGAHCIVTDLMEVLPDLQVNINANAPAAQAGTGSCLVT